MKNQIQLVPIGRLVANPGSPNRMSKSKFNKLVRNIERTGLYEPLIVRPSPSRTKHRDEAATLSERGRACPERNRRDARDMEAYEIINGHQRWRALRKLSFERVDVVVWDVDDRQADIFLATLNRLGGSDVLEKKLTMLERLSEKLEAAGLAKLLPQSARQIERLASLARSDRGRACSERNRRNSSDTEAATQTSTPQCVVFFLNDEQKEVIEKAMSLACDPGKTKAARNAATLTRIAEMFIDKKADKNG